MSAPTRDVQLEEYADQIGMTEEELIDFCTSVLHDREWICVHKSALAISEYSKFHLDMFRAGYDVEEYNGRFGWKGPATRTSHDGPSLQDIMRATTVKLQWDQIGSELIVYPKDREESW